jgi:hypothetical protein
MPSRRRRQIVVICGGRNGRGANGILRINTYSDHPSLQIITHQTNEPNTVMVLIRCKVGCITSEILVLFPFNFFGFAISHATDLMECVFLATSSRVERF